MGKTFRRTMTGLTTAALVTLAIIYLPAAVFPYAVGLLALLAVAELFGLVARRLPPSGAAFYALFLPCAALLVAALSVLPYVALTRGNLMMLYLIAVVKLSDMGGFAIGLSCGRHKLCPSISPNKTWEGLAGSVLGASLLSLAFMPITGFGAGKALACGLVAALVGTAGDLAESKLKRWAGVKDSATFMPAGMGGFLDMLDSLVFAPAVLAAFL